MKRSAGILLSITSLPSKYGIGCFDKAAYDFVDFLVGAGQSLWQILPLNPTCFGEPGDSPYKSYSAFAGNPYFISLDALVEEGVLTEEEVANADFGRRVTSIDYKKLNQNRYPLLRKAYERSNIAQDPEYQQFLRENEWWLSDYALFMALTKFFDGQPWNEWPEDIRLHWANAVDHYHRILYFDVEFQKYMQFKFQQQWQKLKKYANSKNIQIVGDIPIYVAPNSADVWAHPELFQLDENNMPTAIAGCPPDAFSPTGQVWGNPLYRWDYHRSTGFDWWCSRVWYMFRLYDVVRIDHFRGFDEYFSIPADSDSAMDGHWEKGPGMDLFNTISWRMGRPQVIVEDLGLMTDSVRQLVRATGFPNIKVLQFGFDLADIGAANDYLPHNYPENCIVYTGTHDNETVSGWYQNLSDEEKALVRDYICDHHTPDKELYHSFISAVMRTCASMCIVPIQDHLGLDNSSRMNVPATKTGNWCWRMRSNHLTPKLQKEILAVTKRYGRMNWANSEEKE